MKYAAEVAYFVYFASFLFRKENNKLTKKEKVNKAKKAMIPVPIPDTPNKYQS